MYSSVAVYRNSEEVLTGFYNEEPDFNVPLKESTFPNDITVRTANYIPYDLFCFNSKMREKVSSLKPTYNHRLEGVGRNGRTYLSVVLYDGGELVPITPELKDLLSKFTEECERTHPGKCLLFSTHRDIWYDNVCLPAYWMDTLLPFLEIPDEFSYLSGITESSGKIIERGYCYVTLNPDTRYSELYSNLRNSITKDLYLLYKSGSLVSTDDDFVNKWRLSIVRGNLYTTEWTHYLVENCKTQFLLDCSREDSSVKKGEVFYSPKSLLELCGI